MNQQQANELISKIDAHKAAGGILYALGEDDEGHPRFWAHREYRAETVRSCFDYYKVHVWLSECDAFWVRARDGKDVLLAGREVYLSLEASDVFFTETEMFQRFRENMRSKIERLEGFLRTYDDLTFIKWDVEQEVPT